MEKCQSITNEHNVWAPSSMGGWCEKIFKRAVVNATAGAPHAKSTPRPGKRTTLSGLPGWLRWSFLHGALLLVVTGGRRLQALQVSVETIS